MGFNLETLSVLAAPVARMVFEQVARKRFVRFGELLQHEGVDRDTARQALQQLKRADLVKESGSAIEDFNTYYVTANGLEASRSVGIKS